MLHMGEFRKSDCATIMSAFPPLATELRTSLEVRFVPNLDIVLLFDRLAFGL